ncbi:hypothetical protein HN51_013996 [Arachis hypogaea]|uniref:uncharacterized protein LOC107631677 n=1 Tax=Arachis ipaensis TaxID=130454 RepID=UPI0007AF4638|nr:uncharacterized protein LOC107631677 [Arachis ipaensis]XP_025640921.1 uncharacterized protein LOC112735609 [Arachis hypogaea]
MESESKQVMKKQRKKQLEVLDILKEALTIHVKNTNFIIFAFLTSLPLLFLMLHFETLFQQTLVDTPRIVKHILLQFNNRLYGGFNYGHVIILTDDDGTIHLDQDYTVTNFSSKDYLPNLIQLVFMYLVPLHVLELGSAALTVYVSSKLKSEDERPSLKQMFLESFDASTMKGTFITSLYLLSMSSGILLAAAWTVSNSYILYMTFGCYIVFALICFAALTKLLMVYLEWSAIWNMSIVISVMDGIHGAGALRVSFFLSSGNQKRGLYLMLVFFALGVCFRLPCIFLGCYKGGSGIFVQVGLFFLVNTLKWVSCMIYFSDCKERKLEKKIDDVEVGKDLQSGS